MGEVAPVAGSNSADSSGTRTAESLAAAVADAQRVERMNEKTIEKTTEKTTVVPPTPSSSRMLVIDIGKKQRKKSIKLLRKGRGRLMTKIEAAVQDVQKEAGASNALPIVFVVRQRRGRRGLLF